MTTKLSDVEDNALQAELRREKGRRFFGLPEVAQAFGCHEALLGTLGEVFARVPYAWDDYYSPNGDSAFAIYPDLGWSIAKVVKHLNPEQCSFADDLGHWKDEEWVHQDVPPSWRLTWAGLDFIHDPWVGSKGVPWAYPFEPHGMNIKDFVPSARVMVYLAALGLKLPGRIMLQNSLVQTSTRWKSKPVFVGLPNRKFEENPDCRLTMGVWWSRDTLDPTSHRGRTRVRPAPRYVLGRGVLPKK